MVHALVSGSRVYTVQIEVTPLAMARWKQLVAECAGQIDSLIALLQGELPDAVLERLCDRATGIFPSSKQLTMTCSCPDWAGLCKHLAAVLYGVGARLDREPELLFVLRGVDKLDLLGEAAGGTLIERTADEGSLAPDALGDIFGIELDSEKAAPPKKPRSTPRGKERGKRPSASPQKPVVPPAPKRSRAARASSTSNDQAAEGEVADYRKALKKLSAALEKAKRRRR